MKPEQFIQQPPNVKKVNRPDYLQELRNKNLKPQEIEELPDDFSELENKIDSDRKKMAGNMKEHNQ